MLEELRNRRVLETQAQLCAGKADLGETRTDRRLSGDEGRASSSAALLTVEVGEHRAIVGDAIEVRRAVAHDALVIATEVEPTDVVSHDEKNVRLPLGHFHLLVF